MIRKIKLIRLIIATVYRLMVLLKGLRSKQCGPRSDCSSMSSLIWDHSVCRYAEISHWRKHLHAADDFSRRHFQMCFLPIVPMKMSPAYNACYMFSYALQNTFVMATNTMNPDQSHQTTPKGTVTDLGSCFAILSY